MSLGNATAIADLVVSNEEWKNGHGKAIIIISGVTALVSTMSSSLLIFIIARSRDRLATTYHRLVFGMCISDIVYSACMMTFGAMYPSDIGYRNWNARGNQATCDAMGFLVLAGMTASLFYSCMLNLNYLAMVKYNCSEAYIRSRIEPFLHAFPIGLAVIFSVVPLAGKNYNGGGGACLSPVYEPRHCTGIKDGQVREGFEIPCGRGRDGFPTFYWASLFLDLLIPPVIIGVSLGLMYKALRNQENQTGKYGAGALNLSNPRAVNDDAAGVNDDAAGRNDGGGGARGGIGHTILSSVTLVKSSLARRSGRRAPTNPERPLSRAVVQRAAAYSFVFFLTWSWAIIMAVCNLALGEIAHALWYLLSIFQPLQGFFNLLIYMQPRVTSARKFRGRELSWRRAIARAFRTSLGLEWNSGEFPTDTNSGWGDDGRRKKHRAPATAEMDTVEVVGPSDRELTGSLAEEEKVEIQGPDDE